DFLRYPDGRAPAQGDTFRLPPRTGKDVRRGEPWANPSCTVLPKAGYAVVKGNHDGKPWMLCLFNTSLSKTHKHEDNLSITLWFDGVEWLIDPSFYSHEYESELPSSLRSAGAHSSPFVEGLSYRSNSDWSARLSSYKGGEGFVIKASHSLYEGVEVFRKIEGDLYSLNLTFEDKFESFKSGVANELSVGFHLGEEVLPCRNEKDFFLINKDSKYGMLIDPSKNTFVSEIKESKAGLEFCKESITTSIVIKPSAHKLKRKLKALKEGREIDPHLSRETTPEKIRSALEVEIKGQVEKCRSDEVRGKDGKSLAEESLVEGLGRRPLPFYTKLKERLTRSGGKAGDDLRDNLQLFKGAIDSLHLGDDRPFLEFNLELHAWGNTRKSELAQVFYDAYKPDRIDVSEHGVYIDEASNGRCSELAGIVRRLLGLTLKGKINALKDPDLAGFESGSLKVHGTILVDVPFICVTISGERCLILTLQSPIDAIYLPTRNLFVHSSGLRFDGVDRLKKLFNW